MVYEWPYIITFFVSILGIILMILRRLPDAVNQQDKEKQEPQEQTLEKLGVQLESVSKFKTTINYWLKRIWVFVLEAKNVKAGNQVGYKIKKMFRRQKVEDKPIIAPLKLEKQNSKTEDQLLELIKADPKNYDYYKALGTLYMDQESYTEAADVFKFVLRHMPGEAALYAKLGYSLYHLKQYDEAIDNYEKSLSLDSTQPGRYYSLGLTYEMNGEAQKAIESLEKAVRIDHDNVKYKEALERIKKTKNKNRAPK